MGSFMTGSHHLLLMTFVSVAALWRRTNHQSTSPGEVSAGTYVPLLLIPLLPRSSAGGYDPSRAAMAGAPVEINPPSQCAQWLGPKGSASRDARWELSYPQASVNCLVAYEDLYICLVTLVTRRWCMVYGWCNLYTDYYYQAAQLGSDVTIHHTNVRQWGSLVG